MTPTEALACSCRNERVHKIIDQHGRDPHRLIPILQAIQDELRYLPREVLAAVAHNLGIPAARVYGVATFYTHFALSPRGKHLIRICDGTACHVRGSTELIDALRAELELDAGQKTTPDMLFTLETVSCLGACGLAPVMVMNEDVHGLLHPEEAVAFIQAARQLEAGEVPA